MLRVWDGKEVVKKVGEELAVTYLPIANLKENPHNSRTHTKQQIRQVANSIREFGFVSPVLVDRSGGIIAGHARVAAAKLLRMPTVPTICLEKLSPDQLRAYVIADNRLAEKAGWDKSVLAIELQHLMSIDADFDIDVLGFEPAEIDLIIAPSNENIEDPDDRFQAPQTERAATQFGDLWCLGRHRLLCGNATLREHYATLLGDRRAAVVFTDPPFNVPIDGNVTGKGAIHHREFPMAVGEMSEFEFTAFLSSCLKLLARYSRNGSVHFVCMDWRHMLELQSAGRLAYDVLINVCVWAKKSGGMGSFYRSRHELIFVFRNGKGRHRNNVELGRHGRNRTNVWEYASVNTLSRVSEEGNLLAMHPTVKPVAMIADALLDCSVRGDLVLDPFLGSGSTLIAAERVGRVCYAMELDPLYVDTAIRRWERYTGERAIHAINNRSFEEITAEAEANHVEG